MAELQPFRQVLRTSWETYTNQFRFFLIVVLCFVFPLQLLSSWALPNPLSEQLMDRLTQSDVTTANVSHIATDLVRQQLTENDDTRMMVGYGALVISWLLSFYLMAAIILGVWRVAKHAPGDQEQLVVQDILRDAKQYWWPLFWTQLLMSLLLGFFFVLFIIPAIIFSVYWAFAGVAVVVTNRKYMHALQYSRRIVRGYWWPTAARFFLVGAMVSIVVTIISIPVATLAGQFSAIQAVLVAISELMGLFISVWTVYYFQDLQRVYESRLSAGTQTTGHVIEQHAEENEQEESEQDHQEE
ncbi:MAG: hypothetical protein HYV32_02270 [Candidatus Kerfeldbacteria bacterium]|nr:hypothetical protein [Candidatus Kerfeldbacteria bacterium]